MGILGEAHNGESAEATGGVESETVEGSHRTVEEQAQTSIDVVDVETGMPLVMLPGTEDEPLADHSATGAGVIQAEEAP